MYSGDDAAAVSGGRHRRGLLAWTFDPAVVDRYIRVSDRDSFRTARAVTRQEGILIGGSAGSAVFAALQVARELDETKTIVVLLPDTGRQYLSKVYSDSWMLQHGMLDVPMRDQGRRGLAAKHGELPPLDHGRARTTRSRRRSTGSRTPISRRRPSCGRSSTDVSQFVGSIRDRELLDRIFRDPDALQADVAEVMAPPIPMVEFDDPIESAFGELEQGPAVLVTKAGRCWAC